MLKQFRAKNFRSFAEDMILDMRATASTEHKESILISGDGSRNLPVAVIYGPNGGGKSNALKAFAALAMKVLNPIQASGVEKEKRHISDIIAKTANVPIIPFLFSDTYKNNSTEFEIAFYSKTAEYRYELHIRDDKILMEQLDRTKFDTKRKSMLFFRSGTTFELKGDLRGLKNNGSISEGLPLLSYLGIVYGDNDIVSEVLGWFLHGFLYLDYNVPNQDRWVLIDEDGKMKSMLINVFHEMDIDIIDYRINKKDDNSLEIFTKHEIDGKKIDLRIEEESSGTQKLFSLLQLVLYALLNGATLVADEMDAKIHPELLQYLITLFTNPETNRKKAQLIFTSHDMHTMNKSLLRRDEIWFAAKTRRQGSQLYSLADFRKEDGRTQRAGADYSRQYLQGRYGADPYLHRIIDWSEMNGEA